MQGIAVRRSLVALRPACTVLTLSFLVALLFGCAAPAPEPEPEPPTVAVETTPDPFGPPSASILLLGTFHFSDAGLDSYKPEFDVDVLSEERQREVEEVVELLAAYRPTKIALEWGPQHRAEVDEQYHAYVNGEFELTRSEVHQLGYRLAAKLGHERVWLVDAKRRFYEPWVDPDEYAAEHGQEHLVNDGWYERYEQVWREEDRTKTERTLRETLRKINRPERILRSHGVYLVGNFEVGDEDEYPGVDAKTAWYNRNLRIFANLQRITEREDERILLIIGHGHVPILRHCVEASPAYRLVEVGEYL